MKKERQSINSCTPEVKAALGFIFQVLLCSQSIEGGICLNAL
jgi:hypothetical protein